MTDETEELMTEAVVAEPVVAEPSPMQVRNAADGYALFAVVFAVIGVIIPVLPAAAALMLVRAVEQEQVSARTTQTANLAATIAYIALAFQAALCLALLVGVFFRAIQ